MPYFKVVMFDYKVYGSFVWLQWSVSLIFRLKF